MHSTAFVLGSGIAAVVLLVVLIARFRLHPFIALLVSGVLLGLVNGLGPTNAVSTFTDGFGKTLSVTGIVIALGTVLGVILLKSGGADRIADVLLELGGKRHIALSMGIAALLIGLPNLFEVTFVLLVPLVYSVSRRLELDLLVVGIPMAAGLMTAHALLPPGPASVLGATAYHANLGLVFLWGSIVAVPVLLSGVWLFPRLIRRWNITGSDGALSALGGTQPTGEQAHGGEPGSGGNTGGAGRRTGDAPGTAPQRIATRPGTAGVLTAERLSTQPVTTQVAVAGPSLANCVVTVMLAPVLMIIGTLVGDHVSDSSAVSPYLDAAANPVITLLLATGYAYVFLGLRQGRDSATLLEDVKTGLMPIIGLLLIVGAGGGLKGTLTGIGLSDIVADAAKSWAISPVLFAWIIAAIFRIALGSGTVAVTTATAIVAPLAATGSPSHAALLVLATCTGAMIFSHVSDGAFWIFKEYFGLTVTETFKTWSLLVTVQSFVGLGTILLLELLLDVV